MDLTVEKLIAQEKSKCLLAWENDDHSKDDRLEFFDHSFESWINQFPEQYIDIVLTLVTNMEYYTHRRVNKFLRLLHQDLLKRTCVTDDDTIYTFIKSKQGYSNSSNDYWTEYKAINRINKYTCIVDISKMPPEAIEAIKKIIVIDDFSGTGESLITEIDNNLHMYKGKEIFFISIGIMEDAILNIQHYCETIDARITFIYAFVQKKAFQRDLFENEADAYKAITNISKKLKIPEIWIMGYGESQALVAFYNNTPNNTLGVLHYDTDKYRSIFPRERERIPSWKKLQKQKKMRENANYCNKTKEHGNG